MDERLAKREFRIHILLLRPEEYMQGSRQREVALGCEQPSTDSMEVPRFGSEGTVEFIPLYPVKSDGRSRYDQSKRAKYAKQSGTAVMSRL